MAVSLRQRISREPFQVTQKHVERVLQWLLRFHQETSVKAILDEGIKHSAIDKPIKEFIQRYKPENTVCEFLNQLQDKFVQFEGQQFPLVHRHGDLSLGNILLTHTGLGVVDWDYGELLSLPLLDLLYFLVGYGYYLSSEGFRKKYYQKGIKLFFADPTDYRELSCKVVSKYLSMFGLSAEWMNLLFPIMLVYAALNGTWAYGFLVSGDLVYYDLLVWYVERGKNLLVPFIKNLQ